MSAFRRGEIQSNNKLWVQCDQLSVKLPRKNAVALIEAEQVKLSTMIDKTRQEIKQTTRDLLELQPNLTEMDPATVSLLLVEQKAKVIVEEDEESD